MAKAASKGKLANKVSSKKNKKSLSVKNQKTLENSDKFKVGSKNDNIPKGKFMFIGGKVGCVFQMVIISILLQAEIGQYDSCLHILDIYI